MAISMCISNIKHSGGSSVGCPALAYRICARTWRRHCCSCLRKIAVPDILFDKLWGVPGQPTTSTDAECPRTLSLKGLDE